MVNDAAIARVREEAQIRVRRFFMEMESSGVSEFAPEKALKLHSGTHYTNTHDTTDETDTDEDTES